MAQRKTQKGAAKPAAPDAENKGRETLTVAWPHGLNLRAAPSTTAQVLRVMPAGARVEIDADANAPDGWAAVVGGGWCMTKYLA